MQTLLIIIIAVVALGMVGAIGQNQRTLTYLAKQQNSLAETVSNNHKETDARFERIIRTTNTALRIYDKDIEDIVKKMELYASDIKRLDEMETKLNRVESDEKEIRTYYINYREPVNQNTGVEWAKDYKTEEDANG